MTIGESVRSEAAHHLPFSVSAVAIGLAGVGLLCFLAPTSDLRPLFHLSHPVHMLFSAAATTAMFARHGRGMLRAAAVGLVGAIGICGLSDIAMPHASLWFFGVQAEWHLCILEHPAMVLSFAAAGVAVGLAAAKTVANSTFFSHSLHVLASTVASTIYLVRELGWPSWVDSIGAVFPCIVLAVMLPCCLSDIAFPLLVAGRGHAGDRPCGV